MFYISHFHVLFSHFIDGAGDGWKIGVGVGVPLLLVLLLVVIAILSVFVYRGRKQPTIHMSLNTINDDSQQNNENERGMFSVEG